METRTKEEVLRRFHASRERKRKFIKQLEQEMKAEYEQRTGLEAKYFEVW